MQYIEFKDGGRILRPTFSPDGEYLVVEQFGGSKSSKIDQKIIFIDLNNLNKYSVKKTSASRHPLKCSDLKWSIAEPSYAYLTAKLSGRERFYKIHYKNMISGNPNYMIEWTDNIFGTGKRGNQLHSFSITEYGNKDIILFCFVDQAKGFVTQNQFGFYRGWYHESRSPELFSWPRGLPCGWGSRGSQGASRPFDGHGSRAIWL